MKERERRRKKRGVEVESFFLLLRPREIKLSLEKSTTVSALPFQSRVFRFFVALSAFFLAGEKEKRRRKNEDDPGLSRRPRSRRCAAFQALRLQGRIISDPVRPRKKQLAESRSTRWLQKGSRGVVQVQSLKRKRKKENAHAFSFRASRRRFAPGFASLKTRPRTFGGLWPEVHAESHGFGPKQSLDSAEKDGSAVGCRSRRPRELRVVIQVKEVVGFSRLSHSRLTLFSPSGPSGHFFDYQRQRSCHRAQVESDLLKETSLQQEFAFRRDRFKGIFFRFSSSPSD